MLITQMFIQFFMLYLVAVTRSLKDAFSAVKTDVSFLLS